MIKLESALATASLRAMYDEIEESFEEWKNEFMRMQGTKPLERASVLFEMTKAIVDAKQRAIAAAVTIQIEERKLMLSHGIDSEHMGAN
jgi:hypothetical protein